MFSAKSIIFNEFMEIATTPMEAAGMAGTLSSRDAWQFSEEAPGQHMGGLQSSAQVCAQYSGAEWPLLTYFQLSPLSTEVKNASE